MSGRLPVKARRQAENHVAKLLHILGVDIANNAELADTPARYVRAMEELTSGIETDPHKLPFPCTTFSSANYDQLIVVPRITFSSTCSHHLLPFFGHVWIGVLPGDRILGYSKYIRITNHYAAKPQTQEEMTQNIANALHEILKPRAVIVVAKGVHTCARVRGVKECSAEMVTSAMKGKSALDVRGEFFELARIGVIGA